MPDVTEKLTLLLETLHEPEGSGVIGLEQGGMKDLGCTGEYATPALVDGPVGPDAE